MKTRSCFTCFHFNVCEMANVLKNPPVRFNIDNPESAPCDLSNVFETIGRGCLSYVDSEKVYTALDNLK